ncbi:hypothetical protein ACK83U_09570 [Rhizobium sp. WW22]|uniref:hypothetical protein n=1 Tax=Rhizobium sp. WW22 TaxID=3389070 RepID=UPI00399ADBE3
MTSPASACTIPRPLSDLCAPASMTPMPNWSCVCLGKLWPVSARTASMPARRERYILN